ncbi:MAG: His/Gly/Thr/Pro-type tRNA ligase C-terminal domain-containing protein [Candidatus Micrarchaeota archaeon]
MAKKMGIGWDKFHFAVLPKDALPHYSRSNVDLEVETSLGTIEAAGTAYRTDFDLASHQKHSGQELAVFLPEEKKKIIPHVVEPSLGVDRPFYALLEHCFREKAAGKEWEWFAFPPSIAPYTVAVFPLMKKDGLPEIAQGIVESLRHEGIECLYSQSGSIGKRYARADEIGVPYCITVDYDTNEKKDATIRFRDDGGQVRLPISSLAAKIRECVEAAKTSLKT